MRVLPARFAFAAMLTIALSSSMSAQKVGREANRDLEDLAAAERAFAAETVELGFRDGFIKFFADDGIGFGPHPERTREKLLKTPPATEPRKVIFNWAPMTGDISDAGDLGYTTGPLLFTDVTDSSKPPRHGIYFSVWQKQKDATWKVVIDMGVDTPVAVAPIGTKFTAVAPVGSRRANPMKGTPSDDYRTLDWAMWSSMAKTRGRAGGLLNLDAQFRVHRKGRLPIVDGAGLSSLEVSATRYEFIDGKIASSGDLAFTYGKYTATYDVARNEVGYYVHVWRRDANDQWRLTVSVQNPLPKSDRGKE